MYFNAKIYINSCILLSMTTLEEEINYIFRGELSYEEVVDLAALREVLRRRGLIPDENEPENEPEDLEVKNAMYKPNHPFVLKNDPHDKSVSRYKDIANKFAETAVNATRRHYDELLRGQPPEEPEDFVLRLAREISQKYNPKMEMTELANRVTTKIIQNPFYLSKFKFLAENNSGLSYKDINDYVYTVLFENNWDVEV